jgi:hypothetical protein
VCTVLGAAERAGAEQAVEKRFPAVSLSPPRTKNLVPRIFMGPTRFFVVPQGGTPQNDSAYEGLRTRQCNSNFVTTPENLAPDD